MLDSKIVKYVRGFCAKRESESAAYLAYVRNSLIEEQCKIHRLFNNF